MPEEPRNYEPTPEIVTQQAPNLENLEIDLFELTSSTSGAEDVFTEDVKVTYEGQPINLKIVRSINDKKENGEINSMYTVFYPTSEEGKRRGSFRIEVENKNGAWEAEAAPMEHPNEFERINLPIVRLLVPNIVQRLSNRIGSPIRLTVSTRGAKREKQMYAPMLQEQGYSKKPEQEDTPWEEWEKVYTPQPNQ